MKEYLLFIDTEASGLPRNWSLPYTAPSNWPNAVQVSWVIYTKEGKKIREQNHYICNNDFEIAATALKIHGLTKNFLQQHGISRRELLTILAKDIREFQPMIVGHFLELDYHIIGADCSREVIVPHPMENIPAFCIMKATKHLQQNPNTNYLRLGELYELLFKIPLLCQHNAMADAAATAECFFELVKRNMIQSFIQPPIVIQQKDIITNRIGWIIVFLLLLIGALLIFYYYG